jgi:hypothetical protein
MTIDPNMSKEDQALAAKAHALVQKWEREHLLDQAKSLRAQATAKIKSAEQFERMAKALEAPAG